MRTVDITPKWMDLARICIDDLKRSDLSTRNWVRMLTITLLEDACTHLDNMNEEIKKEGGDSNANR